MSQRRKAPARPVPRPSSLLERPLTARSVIASLLLGMHPPRLSSARLVRWCSLFGMAEGTARVALSRMVERGELTASDGTYELVGAVRERQPGFDWAIEPELEAWDGRWLVALVTAEARSAGARAELRRAMAQVRFGERREGVWVRPANLPRSSAAPSAWSVVDDQCEWWQGSPAGDPVGEADRLFAPGRWSERADVLVVELERVRVSLGNGTPPARDRRDWEADGDGDDLAAGFTALAAALQHLRRDPLLPEALLPELWPGPQLRNAYRACQTTYAAAVGAFFAGSGPPR